MSSRSIVVAVLVGKAVLWLLRFSLYVVLLLVGRLLMPVANVAIVLGLFSLLVTPLFIHHNDAMRHGVMWLGGGIAFSAVVLQMGYYRLLSLTAPARTVLVYDL
jgi:hypothetical protein